MKTQRGSIWRVFGMIALLASVSTAEAAGQKVFLHLKTGITQDDNPMCAAFNIAWAALKVGNEVEMFFDAGAVFDLQNTATENSTADTQPTSAPASQPTKDDGSAYNLRYKLPDKLKQILSAQFDVPQAQLPATYYGYLKMLKDKGAKVTFNGAMAHLVSLSDSVKGNERIVDIATPLSLSEIIQERASADLYFAY